MLDQIIKENTKKMDLVIEKSKSELSKLTPNLASPNILSDIMIEYYGSHISMLQLANVNIVDGRHFFIKPYDLKMITTISAAIIKKNIGLIPQQNADNIIVKIPQLTEEKRKSLVKKMYVIIENHKIAIRNIRRNVNQQIKKDQTLSQNQQKTLEDKIQKLTDKNIEELTNISLKKQKELLHI